LREVEKYPSIVELEPGTLALIDKVITNFTERTDLGKLTQIYSLDNDKE